MGCDIHWVIERQDSQGNWHSVLSKSYAINRYFGENAYLSSDFLKYASTPIMSLADRNYSLFTVLSRVRAEEEDGAYIANDGLPEDASNHTLDYLDYDGDLHSHGYFTLGELKRSIAEQSDDIFGSDEHGLLAAEQFLRNLIATVSAEENVSTILPASVYADDDEHYERPYATMDRLSSHEKLRLVKLSQQLKSVGDDSLRVLIAYDN